MVLRMACQTFRACLVLVMPQRLKAGLRWTQPVGRGDRSRGIRPLASLREMVFDMVLKMAWLGSPMRRTVEKVAEKGAQIA